MHYIAEPILYEIKKNLIHGENRRDQTCTFMMKIRFSRISISAILTQISQFLKTIKSLEMHGVYMYIRVTLSTTQVMALFLQSPICEIIGIFFDIHVVSFVFKNRLNYKTNKFSIGMNMMYVKSCETKLISWHVMFIVALAYFSFLRFNKDDLPAIGVHVYHSIQTNCPSHVNDLCKGWILDGLHHRKPWV